jgi:hypothetical protein
MEPTEILSAGNDTLSTYLTHVDLSASSTLAVWNLQRWRPQLQPAHILRLWSNLASVDIRYFCDSDDIMNQIAADSKSPTTARTWTKYPLPPCYSPSWMAKNRALSTA